MRSMFGKFSQLPNRNSRGNFKIFRKLEWLNDYKGKCEKWNEKLEKIPTTSCENFKKF